MQVFVCVCRIYWTWLAYCCFVQAGSRFLQLTCRICCNQPLPVLDQHFHHSVLVCRQRQRSAIPCQWILQQDHAQNGSFTVQRRCRTSSKHLVRLFHEHSLNIVSKFFRQQFRNRLCHSPFQQWLCRRPSWTVHRWRRTTPWFIPLQVSFLHSRRVMAIPHALVLTMNLCRGWSTLPIIQTP